MFRLLRLIIFAVIAMAVAIWISKRAEAFDPAARLLVSHTIPMKDIHDHDH